MRKTVLSGLALVGAALFVAAPIGLSAGSPAAAEPATRAVLILMPGTAAEHVIPMATMAACTRASAYTSSALCMGRPAAEA